MIARDTGILPVVEQDEQLIGVLTDRDIAIRGVAQGVDPDQTEVRDFMSAEPLVTCKPTEDINIAIQYMKEKQVRRLVVTDNDQHVVGVLSLADLAANQGTSEEAGKLLMHVSEPQPTNLIETTSPK